MTYSIQLLSALKECENRGIIHRDIKPKNIFVNYKTAILGDFGLMKLVNSPIESEEEFREDTDSLCYGQALHYRCPDIIRYVLSGEQLTTKANIFSIGLVIAEMFGKQNPQKSQNFPIHLTSRERYLSNIEWNDPRFGYISPEDIEKPDKKKEYTNRILIVLTSMLQEKPEERPCATQCLTEFIDIFTDYIKHRNLKDT